MMLKDVPHVVLKTGLIVALKPVESIEGYVLHSQSNIYAPVLAKCKHRVSEVTPAKPCCPEIARMRCGLYNTIVVWSECQECSNMLEPQSQPMSETVSEPELDIEQAALEAEEDADADR